jgi:DNA-binding LytR/AlgR family response regulator
MHDFEKRLGAGNFLRTHRSFIVNLEAIEAYNSSHVEISGQYFPIGRQYRDAVMQHLQKKIK